MYYMHRARDSVHVFLCTYCCNLYGGLYCVTEVSREFLYSGGGGGRMGFSTGESRGLYCCPYSHRWVGASKRSMYHRHLYMPLSEWETHFRMRWCCLSSSPYEHFYCIILCSMCNRSVGILWMNLCSISLRIYCSFKYQKILKILPTLLILSNDLLLPD